MTYFELDDRAVYLPQSDTLILADVHFGADTRGYEDELATLTGRVDRLLDEYTPQRVILAGDLYEIPRGSGPPPAEMHHTVEQFHAHLDAACEEVITTPGNHEYRGRLGPRDLPGRVEPEYRLDDDAAVVFHGHTKPEMTGDLYIIGHAHPWLPDGNSPCYLYGENVARDAAMLIIPPFNHAVGGTSIEQFYTNDSYVPLVREEGDGRRLVPVVGSPDTKQPFPR